MLKLPSNLRWLLNNPDWIITNLARFIKPGFFMLSRQQIRFITSLQIKKIRREQQLFSAEGSKLIEELLHSRLIAHSVYAHESWLQNNRSLIESKKIQAFAVSDAELIRISSQKTANQAVAVFQIPFSEFDPVTISNEIVLMLDDINDPGNLGTILRTADWFGIQHVVCSPGTVDLFNPKTIQATMGSIARVNVCYTNLYGILSKIREPVYGAVLKGKSLREIKKTRNGIIIIGNEAHGISPSLHPFITYPLTIPSPVPDGAGIRRPESLNAAIAAAILCWEFTN